MNGTSFKIDLTKFFIWHLILLMLSFALFVSDSLLFSLALFASSYFISIYACIAHNEFEHEFKIKPLLIISQMINFVVVINQSVYSIELSKVISFAFYLSVGVQIAILILELYLLIKPVKYNQNDELERW